MNVFITVLILGISSLSISQTIYTEAPSVSASAVTVPKNAFQIETGLKFYESRFTNSPQVYKYYNFSMPYSLFRYGLTEKIEIRATADLNRISNNGTTVPQYYFNEIGVGAKFQIMNKPDAATQFAAITHLNLYNQESSFKGGYLNLALAHSFGPNHSIGFNIGVRQDIRKEPALYIGRTKFNTSFVYTAKLNDKLSILGELFATSYNSITKIYSTVTNQSDFREEIGCDVGIMFLPVENIQLDYNFGIGKQLNSYSIWNTNNIYYLYHSIGFNILLNN